MLGLFVHPQKLTLLVSPTVFEVFSKEVVLDVSEVLPLVTGYSTFIEHMTGELVGRHLPVKVICVAICPMLCEPLHHLKVTSTNRSMHTALFVIPVQ
jgi:hypothetical protein